MASHSHNALSQSEERFHWLSEATLEGIIIHDQDQILDVNSALIQTFGYSAAELVKMSVLDLIAPQSLPFVEQQTFLDYDKPYEALGLKKDGSTLFIEIHARVLRCRNHWVRATVIRDISDRKAIEAALRQSETTTQALLSAIPDLLIRFTSDGVCLTYIPAKTFTTLNNPEEVIGKSIWEIMPTDLAYQRMDYIDRAIQTGEVQIYEYTIQVDNQVHYEEARITVCGENEVLVIVRDISARKRAETELRQSRDQLEMRVHERTIELQEAYQQLSLLIDNSPLAVIEWDTDFRIQGWSHQAEKVFGWKAEEVLGKSINDWKFVYEEDLAEVQQVMCDLKTNKVSQIVTQNRNYTKDGKVIHCEWHESILIDGEGNFLSALSIAQDITTRKQAEREIRLLQTITQAISEADNFTAALEVTLRKICQVTQWDLGEAWIPAADGSRLEISPAWYASTDQLYPFRIVSETFVFPRNIGISGRVWDTQQLEWHHDVSELPPDCFLRVRSAQQVGLKAAFGIPIVANDKVVAVFLFFAFASREFDENLLKLVISVASQLGQVIQRKKAEEALLKARDELEMRVRERTEELRNVNTYLQSEIVKRAKLAEQLKRSNQELEQFAYVASHDLQEPLRAITSYTQLLAKRYQDNLDERADKYINYIVDGATQMQRLITDLLAYSRVGRHELKLEQINCNAVLERVLLNLKVAIAESSAVITSTPLPTLKADAGQITQLLQNLLSNAIKYCNKAVPEIQITAVQNGEEWIFSIQDNGIGIEPQYLERIFIIFQRLHTRGEYSGTGIGLAICKKIVERHKGRIWVDSIPEQGSTFSFSLPKA
jgi:PAS domain S-box-containing protein